MIAIACGRSSTASPPLREVTLPDLTRVDTTVQDQIRQQDATLRTVLANDHATDAQRAAEFGRLGMLLHAAEYYDAAEPAYLNAQALAPAEPRWPYYLAHLYKTRGEHDRSKASFEHVLQLRPDDVPTLVWLGRASLERGDAAEAERLLERADRAAPRTVAVLAARGQAALIRRDLPTAVKQLEAALEIDPSAASLHSSLATAYRALGNASRAEAHARAWRNTEIPVPDRLRQELELTLNSALSFELRGVHAMEARDFQAAADFFRAGLKVSDISTPLGRSLRHKLGTALYLSGDTDAAMEQFTAVVNAAPATGTDDSTAKAHYSLGVVMASRDRVGDAITHLEAAVRWNPTYVEAHQVLGDTLRRSRRDQAALSHYSEALRLNPNSAESRFGYALALVGLGRYRGARDWVADAMQRHPDRTEFKHALARLLAASPDDAVRDGPRALALVDELLTGPKSPALGETTAMALAENGRFDEAVDVQRKVIEAARSQSPPLDAAFMTTNLRRYESHRPCRTPWRDGETLTQ